MSRVIETPEGEFWVVTSYDGVKIAGPYQSKGDAFEAQADTSAPVVRSGRGQGGTGGFVVVDENSGQQLGETHGKYLDAVKERDMLVKRQLEKGPAKRRPAKEA